MTKSQYHHVSAGEWIPTKRRGNYEQCCDCGLVHVTDYRINKFNQIEYRTKVHHRATNGARKNFKFDKDE
jgi:hypothetical protein